MGVRLLKFCLFFCALLITAVNLALPLYAFAQALPETKFSEEEKAVFAFFSLTGTAPDYVNWIQANDAYEKAQSAEAATEYYETESYRLKWGFKDYKEKQDFITIKTDVVLQVTEKDSSGTASIIFHFPGNDADYIPYFPFPYGDEWISLVVEDLPKFSRLPMNQTQYDHISKFLPDTKKKYSGRLHLKVRPTQVDKDKPFMLDNIPQWLMMGDVATIQCSAVDPDTGKEEGLWEYSAPWILSDLNSLRDQLYK